MIFDVHAHYDDEAFDPDRQTLLQSLPEKGVVAVVNASTEAQTAQAGIKYAEQYPFFWTMVGYHPQCADKAGEGYLDEMEQQLQHPKAVAVGEIGLDYYWDDVPHKLQKKVFEQQLALALELDLPVVVHDRQAHQDTLELLKKYKPRGFVHCFSGSVEMAREIYRLGMSVSLGGVVTFKNARHSVEVVKDAPLDRLLLETDAPYLAPVPFRGKRCDSSMILYSAEKMAQLRGMPVEALLAATAENACAMYGIDPKLLKGKEATP
ncbi:MAG: TatD family hydrolase [Acutalibacteraceae bacterium]|nr:TatD family hydrolase [Acutalibacteraceae bacterium]